MSVRRLRQWIWWIWFITAEVPLSDLAGRRFAVGAVGLYYAAYRVSWWLRVEHKPGVGWVPWQAFLKREAHRHGIKIKDEG